MLDKDPTSYSMLTYSWVIGLSALGGLVSWLRKLRDGKTRVCNLTELLGEIVTSGFAGVLTFWLCEASDINGLVSAAMGGISGHMGSRVIMQIEQILNDRLPGGSRDQV